MKKQEDSKMVFRQVTGHALPWFDPAYRKQLRANKSRVTSAGFTLTELLMVVVILGILAGIALPRFAPQTEKARVSEPVGMLSAIRQGEEAYALENAGAFCDPVAGSDSATPAAVCDWASLGMEDPDSGTWTYTVNIVTPAYTATRAGAAAAADEVTLNRDGTWAGDHPNRPRD